MGNIYVKGFVACPNACSHCTAPEVLHLGKVRTHSVTLRAYEESPLGPLMSFADWKAALLSTPGATVESEYGTPLVISEVIAELEGMSVVARRESYRSQMTNDWAGKPAARVESGWNVPNRFLDAEGFSFLSVEFF